MGRTLAVVFLLAAVPALCAQTTWTGTVSTAWNTPGNWTAGVPNSATAAIIAPTANNPTTNGAAAAACGGLTVQASATLQVASGFPLSVQGNLSVSGNVTGTAALRMTGSGTLASSTSVPVVEIPAGPYTLTNATIGNLTQFAGAAAVTIQNASVDQCHFLGSAIVGAPASLLAAANAVEIRCTTPVTTPPTTITIGGLWTSDSSWQPASGKVLFTGPIGPSAIIAPNTHWFDLEIDAAFGLALTGDLVVDNALRMRSDVTMSGTTIDLGARAGLTFGADLNANNVTTLRIRNGLISAGSIHAPHATMTAAGDITLFITGVLDLGGGTHTVSDTFNVAGVVTMPPAGTLVFTGAGNITVSAFSLLPNVRITGTNYTILDGTITNLTHDVGAGNLNILRCTVQGQCSFRGASVQDFNHGTLTAGGPLLWQTATVVSNPPSMITSSGSWTSDASFAPAAGLVVFNGAGAQAVSVPAFHWHDLRIAAGTSVSTPLAVTIDGLLDVQGTLNAGGNAVSVAGPLTVAGSLQDNSATSLQAHGGLNVAGTLQATAAAIDVNGDAVVPGTLAIGPGGHLFSNSLTVTGTMTVPPNQLVTFDGSGVINVVLSSPLRSVQFTGTAYDVQSLKVTQDLTQSAGTLRIQRCDVGGHAILQGSQVLDLNTGLLSVTGDLDWLTSSAVTAPPATIQCGGNWSANSAFAPASGLVELNGNGPQAVTMISFLWFNLRIGPNSTVNTGQDATTHGFLDLLGHLSCGGSSVHVDGALTIAAGGALNAGAAINLVLGANASIAGTLAMAAAVIDAHRDLSVAATGAVVLGNGTHLLRGGLSQLGSLTLPAGSQVQFLGDGDVQAIAGQPLPRVTFAGGIYNVIDLTVAGALLQTSGRLLITNLHALSTATFQGTSIANNGPSQLQVDGNLALQTANAVTSPPDTIICGGTWTSNSQFLPVSGTIVMNGAGAQSMTAPVLSLSSLTVVPTSVVSFSTSDVILQANLTVNGRVNAPTGGLEIRGNLSVGNGGILQLAAGGTCTVAGSCTNAGSITGPTVLDLVGTGTLSGAGAFPQVDVRGIGEVSVSGNVLFGQSLTVTGGTLRLLGGSNLHVLGNLVGTAGALRGTVGGVLMVDGNVTLSGTVAHATGVPTIHCAGNWLALGTFAPTSGTVFLDGPGTLGTLGGAIHFAALDIGSAVRQLVGNLGVTAQTMHVQAGGELRVASTHLDLTATTATIDGTLALSAGGRLFLGAATALTVTATGAARLVGTFAAPVVIDGPPGGAYSFTMQGAIEAMNYEFHRMGPAGVTITPTATIAALPRDLRGGLFADGDATANACLLRIDRSATTELRYIRFANVPATATFNVRSLGTGVVQFVNEGGAFAGPAFEDDPNNVIVWLPQQRTTVSRFSATAAVHRTEIAFTTTAEVDALVFHLKRGDNSSGPFSEIANSPVPTAGTPTTGSSYARTDLAVVDTTKYFYHLEEELLHGELRLLGSDFARPWPQSIGNVLFVGTNGGYPDLGAAVAAAVPGSNIVVQAGTYPAFVIDKPVRIVPDGSGPVIIDTSAARLTIHNIPAGSFDLTIANLVVGGASSPFGMEVVNCDNVIVLESLTVTAGTGVIGLNIDNTSHLAIQNSNIGGDPGLVIQNGSLVYLSRGSADELRVLTGSNVTYCDLTPGSLTVGPTAAATLLPGLMPDLQFKPCWHGDKPVDLTIRADPGSFFGVVFSLRRDFLDLTPVFPIDMVLLLDQTLAITLLTATTPPSGQVTVPVISPGNPVGWGVNLPLQVLTLQSSGQGRMGTSHDIVFVP